MVIVPVSEFVTGKEKGVSGLQTRKGNVGFKNWTGRENENSGPEKRMGFKYFFFFRCIVSILQSSTSIHGACTLAMGVYVNHGACTLAMGGSREPWGANMNHGACTLAMGGSR